MAEVLNLGRTELRALPLDEFYDAIDHMVTRAEAINKAARKH